MTGEAAKLDTLEQRVRELEVRTEVIGSDVKHMEQSMSRQFEDLKDHQKELFSRSEKRNDKNDAHITWLIRLVIGAIIMALLAVIIPELL